MPQPTYQSWVGIAKETTGAAYLAASVAAGATTITLTNTSVPALSTIFIWDGPNSESKAVSAGGGTTTLTVAALTFAHPANVYVTAQLTASLGPTDYIPVTSIDIEDVYDDLEDKGYRGSAVETYNIVQGSAHSELTLGGDAFADTVGYWLGGVLGATDFTAGTPNTHAFSVKNTSDGQPTSYDIYVNDVVNTRAFPSARVQSVALTFSADGLLTYSTKLVGMASGIVANPTKSYSTLLPLAAWTGLTTIGGTITPTLISGDMTIQRAVNAINTVDGTYQPYRIYAGQLGVSGKLTFVMEDDSQLNNMISNSQPSLDLNFSTGSGASLQAIQLHCSKAAWTSAKPTFGADYVQVDVNYQGLANTTDATTAGTGFSPVKVTLRNAKATGSYL